MKKKIVIVLFIILIILVLSIFLYDKFLLNIYSNDYFSIEYNNEWNLVNSDNQSIYLSNNNESYIQVVTTPLNDEDKENIHFDLHKKYLDENKSYVLLSSGETTIGKNYYDAHEYIFKSKNYQSMLIILVKEDNVIQINYVSKSTNFMFDLDYFYDVVNTLEV